MLNNTRLLHTEVNSPATVIEGFTDQRWTNRTIYNHFESPTLFMDAVVNHDATHNHNLDYVKSGVKAYEKIDQFNTSYDKLYEDVAHKVKNKLYARGFTTAMLSRPVEFTTEKTGVMSKQRAMLGRRDCYFKDPKMTDGKLFHDIYINLSYSWTISDSKIRDNAYALYALCKEVARLIPIRVIVVNHVGTDTPTCYSYMLKKFGQPINPKEFLFFTSDSKRTFGWATYDLLNPGNSNSAVGEPKGTVSIADFSLDREIDTIWQKLSVRQNVGR